MLWPIFFLIRHSPDDSETSVDGNDFAAPLEGLRQKLALFDHLIGARQQ
jgi:hypothetical protein